MISSTCTRCERVVPVQENSLVISSTCTRCERVVPVQENSLVISSTCTRCERVVPVQENSLVISSTCTRCERVVPVQDNSLVISSTCTRCERVVPVQDVRVVGDSLLHNTLQAGDAVWWQLVAVITHKLADGAVHKGGGTPLKPAVHLGRGRWARRLWNTAYKPVSSPNCWVLLARCCW